MADETEPNPRVSVIDADIARARAKRADAVARVEQLDGVLARLEQLREAELAPPPTPPSAPPES